MEHLLRINNIYSHFLSSDERLKQKLFEAFRHREENFFMNPAYKQRRWDGYTNFFSKKSGQILTGLLPELTYALKHKFKVKYEIIDKRNQFDFAINKVDSNFLKPWLPDIELFDFQVDLINSALKYKRGIIKAPTGAGKTLVMGGILKALPPNTPTLVLTKTKDLVEQNYEEIKNLGFKNVGRLYDKYKEPNVITVTTTMSAHKLEKIFHRIRCVLVDEVHLCMSNVPVKKVYKKLKDTPVRIAVSATPFKEGGKIRSNKFNTKGHFGAVFLTRATDTGELGELTTKMLQNRDILSPSDCTVWEVDDPQLPYATWQDAVKYGIAENEYFHNMVKKIVQKKCEGRTLILVERIEQGDRLASRIPGAYWIRGEDDVQTRASVVEKLKSSPSAIAIVSQQLITAGLNVKIHNLINAAGGKAIQHIIQRMGRGLRKAGDKDILYYHDFLHNTNDYLRDHSEKRIATLVEEGHPLRIKEFDL